MSGKSSQRKGRAAELELSRVLQGYGYDVRPGEPLNYGKEPDLIGLPLIHIECKRHQQLRIPDWMKQAADDAKKFKDGAPTFFFRRDRESWMVCMRLEDWMTLYNRQKPIKSAEEE